MPEHGVFIPDPVQWNLAFKSWTGDVGQHLMRKTTQLVGVAKLEAPKKSMDLANAIYPDFGLTADGDLESRVIANKRYAIYVHKGTRRHVIRPKRAERLAFFWAKEGGVFFDTEVTHPGTKADPFLERAMRRVF